MKCIEEEMKKSDGDSFHLRGLRPRLKHKKEFTKTQVITFTIQVEDEKWGNSDH